MDTTIIAIRISKDDLDKVREIAYDRDRTIAYCVREAVKMYIESKKNTLASA